MVTHADKEDYQTTVFGDYKIYIRTTEKEINEQFKGDVIESLQNGQATDVLSSAKVADLSNGFKKFKPSRTLSSGHERDFFYIDEKIKTVFLLGRFDDNSNKDLRNDPEKFLKNQLEIGNYYPVKYSFSDKQLNIENEKWEYDSILNNQYNGQKQEPEKKRTNLKKETKGKGR